MTRSELVKRLLSEQDLEYRDFHASLLPNIDKKTIIGVRVPTMRKIAREFADSATPAELAKFMDKLPHRYFEENQVHLFVAERIKNADECLRRIEQFLPYIDNWAVCDGKSPKALLKDEKRFVSCIEKWLKSREPYTVRFGVNMLMNFFLDARFNKKFLKWVAAIDESLFNDDGRAECPTDRYYVQMVRYGMRGRQGSSDRALLRADGYRLVFRDRACQAVGCDVPLHQGPKAFAVDSCEVHPEGVRKLPHYRCAEGYLASPEVKILLFHSVCASARHFAEGGLRRCSLRHRFRSVLNS